jgi:hypothetical protein
MAKLIALDKKPADAAAFDRYFAQAGVELVMFESQEV